MTDALPLEKLLAEVDSVVADLDAVTPRLTLTANYGERTSSGSKIAPAPVNIDAVSAKHALHVWLYKTAIRLQASLTTSTGRSPQALASHLLVHMPTIVQLGWTTTLHTELAPLMRDATQAAHTAAKKEFAGTCQTDGCKTELWTTQGSDDARCKTCGTEYTQIRSWRTQARTYAQDTEHNIIAYPQALAERLARIHGETIGADYIRVLAARGILKRANPERGSDGKKLRAMYKLGDVKNLLGNNTANTGT